MLQKSGSLDLPKHSTLMHPNDYTSLPQLRCLYQGRLGDLPQRQQMEMGEAESVIAVYLQYLLGTARHRVRSWF